MMLFYLPDFNEHSQEIQFDKEESRHMSKVLRLKEGQQIQLTNGKGLIATVEIVRADPKHTEGRLISSQIQPPPSPNLHIAIAPTKMNDRYEWFLEKATEIGINRITPIICEHSERKILKMDRMQKIVISAMKQSLRANLPLLDVPIKLADFLQELPKTDSRFIAHCSKGDKKPINEAFAQGTSTLILIGPEGDFSENEILNCEKQDFAPISLGNQRLRTETAGLVATMGYRLTNPS